MTNNTEPEIEEHDELEFLPLLDDEHVAVVHDEEPTIVGVRPSVAIATVAVEEKSGAASAAWKTFIAAPFVFVTVALLGGLRFAAPDAAFVFLRPPLFCLIAAALLIVIFFRARLVTVEGWFSDEKTPLANIASGFVLTALFAASTQIFNALLPESGLPFWIFAFCFLWTLWNNLFADFDVRKLLKSLAALFGFAFVVKYLVLAALTSPSTDGSLLAILQSPLKSGATWLFDLPQYTSGTGYIQFFTVIFYLLGLSLLPRRTN